MGEYTKYDKEEGISYSRYDKGFELKSSKEDDLKMYNYLKEHQNDMYHLFENNCKDLIRGTLTEVEYYNMDALRPNDWYKMTKAQYKYFTDKYERDYESKDIKTNDERSQGVIRKIEESVEAINNGKWIPKSY